jgi:hypothetical protein
VLTFSFLLLAIPLFRVPADCPAPSVESIRKRIPKRVSKLIRIIEPGSAEDRSIEGFCIRHDLSKSGFYRMPEEVRDKLVTVLGPRTLRITPAAEASFDRAHAKPNSTEQRLLNKLKAKRVAKAKKAAAASLAGPRHVSKQRKRRS